MPRSKIRNSSFAIDVGGVNGGIIIPNSPSLNPTDYIAVVIRVYLKQGVPCNLIDNSTNGVTNHIYCYVDGLGKLYWYSTIGGVARNLIGYPAIYKPNDYNDYVFLFDSSKIVLMGNGEVAGTVYTTGALSANSQAFRIGQYWTGAVTSQALFSVVKVFHTNDFKLEDHLDFMYKEYIRPEIQATCVFDADTSTGSGTTVFDLSGRGNHGTFSRGVWSTIVPYKARVAASGRAAVSGRTAISGRQKIISDYDDSDVIPRLLTLQAWFKGDGVIGQANGSLQTEWNDVSGNAKHVAAAGSLRPTFYNSTPGHLLNGLPTMFFNGSNSFKLNSGFNGQPFTIFLVARSNVEPTLQYFFDGATANTAAIYRLSFNHRILAGAALGFIGGTSTPWRILTAVFNGVNSVCGLDATEVLGNTGTASSSGITIGAGGDNSSGLNGNIAEVIIAVGIVDASVRKQVRQYLASKYALPS